MWLKNNTRSLRFSILKRLLSAILSAGGALFILAFAVFFLGRLLPIDPVLSVVGDRSSHEAYEQARIALGLHLPLYEQFYLYLLKLCSGDLGISFTTSHPILEDLKRVFPATVELATFATIIGSGIGIPLGVIAAAYSGKWIDKLVRILGLVGYSVPIFWLCLLSLLFFYAHWDLVPGSGRLDLLYADFESPTGFIIWDALRAGNGEILKDALHHLILPASILGYFNMAYISRMTRSFMLEEFSKPYIFMARVKGLSEARIIWIHAFKNIRAPLLTVLALSYGLLLEGSVVTETIFSWPGLGLYLTQALRAMDINAVLGGTLLVGCVFVGLNVVTDFMGPFWDPRMKGK
jgi:peptide/nickel transport system permease protein